jgi:hypothetical protein
LTLALQFKHGFNLPGFDLGGKESMAWRSVRRNHTSSSLCRWSGNLFAPARHEKANRILLPGRQ